MNKTQLRILKKKLLDAKSDLVRRIQRLRHDLRDTNTGPIRDSGDCILEFTSCNFLLSESSLLCMNLSLVEDALERIKLGTYGRCSECGKHIEEKRLSAIPWAPLCVGCQGVKENRDSSPRWDPPFQLSEKSHQSALRTESL